MKIILILIFRVIFIVIRGSIIIMLWCTCSICYISWVQSAVWSCFSVM